MLFKRKKQLVGLDIGSSNVKLVELKGGGKGKSFQLENLGIEPVPPQSIVDGGIMDSFAVSEAIRNLFDRLNVKNTKVAIAVAGNGVIIKKITLPKMSIEELNDQIRFEAEQYIPFEIDEVNIDYEIVDSSEEDQMDVVLVAAKKDVISDYTSVVVQAGLEPVVVDVAAFALQNAYEYNHAINDDTITALVNIGASSTNINILLGNKSLFWRDLSVGGSLYTQNIQKELGIDFDSAESLKKGNNVEGITFDSVIPIIDQTSQELIGEFLKTFEFFKATSQYSTIDKIVLSGGAAKTHGLDKMLEEKSGVGVQIFNPFDNVKVDESVFDPEFINDVSTMVSIAVGLSLRKEM